MTDIPSNEVKVTVNETPNTPDKSYDDITTEHITELCKKYLQELSIKIELFQQRKTRNGWAKYILLASQYVGQIGVIGGGITSALGQFNNSYPIYGVFIFSAINTVGTFVQTVINPDKQMSAIDATLQKLMKLRADMEICQVTKSVERFKDTEAHYDALLPQLL